jgi:hypothetical protein
MCSSLEARENKHKEERMERMPEKKEGERFAPDPQGEWNNAPTQNCDGAAIPPAEDAEEFAGEVTRPTPPTMLSTLVKKGHITPTAALDQTTRRRGKK